MSMLTDNEKARAVRDYARQTNGSDAFFRHPMFRGFLSTNGVQFLAETCGAHWLIDAIASHQTNPKVKAEEFQVWKLEGDGTRNGVLLTCEDGNDNVITKQAIEYSDFPRELMPFKLYLEAGAIPPPGNRGSLVQGQTLMLPEER